MKRHACLAVAALIAVADQAAARADNSLPPSVHQPSVEQRLGGRCPTKKRALPPTRLRIERDGRVVSDTVLLKGKRCYAVATAGPVAPAVDVALLEHRGDERVTTIVAGETSGTFCIAAGDRKLAMFALHLDREERAPVDVEIGVCDNGPFVRQAGVVRILGSKGKPDLVRGDLTGDPDKVFKAVTGVAPEAAPTHESRQPAASPKPAQPKP